MKTKYQKTQSTRFLMPLLYNVKMTDDVKSFVFNAKFFVNEWFINCYLADEGQIAKDNTVYIAYDINLSKEFEDFEEHITSHPDYTTDVVYDNRIVVYTFEVPLVYEREINLFKLGLYSHFEDRYKKEILKFWDLNFVDDNVMYSVLFKTELVINKLSGESINDHSYEISKESEEYWPEPNINLETFKL